MKFPKSGFLFVETFSIEAEPILRILLESWLVENAKKLLFLDFFSYLNSISAMTCVWVEYLQLGFQWQNFSLVKEVPITATPILRHVLEN